MSNPLLKQSSTAQPLLFLLVDATDHITGKTGLTPTVTLSKAGGSFASPAGAVTEIANGWYKVAGNATDTNTLGPLILHATGTGADPVDLEFGVVAFDPQTTSMGLSLAKTTNITGFNDIAATAVVSSGAITTSGGAVSTVTTLTNKSGFSLTQTFPANFSSLTITAGGVASANVVQIDGTANASATLQLAGLNVSGATNFNTLTVTGGTILLGDTALFIAGDTTDIAIGVGAISVNSVNYDLGTIYANVNATAGLVTSGRMGKLDSLTFTVAGKVVSDMRAIDGAVTDGSGAQSNRAALYLKYIEARNPSGTGAVFRGTVDGINATGTTGSGISSNSTTGVGIAATGVIDVQLGTGTLYSGTNAIALTDLATAKASAATAATQATTAATQATAGAASALSADGKATTILADVAAVKVDTAASRVIIEAQNGNGDWAATDAAGTGPVPVDHDGGDGVTVNGVASAADCLRYVYAGSGIAGLTIAAYLASEYDASPPVRVARGRTSTGSDGRWVAPLMLASGTYRLIADTAGDGFAAQSDTIVVP